MLMNFKDDLTETCNNAAKFLREKHREWNEGRSDTEKNYSSESELVAEVYRLLVEKDKNYRTSLHIENIRPDKRGENKDKIPDMVYRGSSGEKALIEFKIIVTKRKRTNKGALPPEQDLGHVKNDYKKLNDPKIYKAFNYKFLVVAFLGKLEFDDGRPYSIEEYKNVISKMFSNKEEIKVIPC